MVMTALKAKSIKTPGRYNASGGPDSKGLMLVVGKDGSRKWVLRVQKDGRRRDVGLGSAATVSLADAREDAATIRRGFRDGKDPVAERRREREKRTTIPTFAEAARTVHEEHKPGWKSAKHAAQWLSTLETYAFPDLGERPVSDVDASMIRDVLIKIWLIKPETARRVRQRIGTVLDFAYANGWRAGEAPMRAVSRGLPRQREEARHYAAMPWKNVPAFVAGMPATLKAGETTRLAIEFLILTAARSGEVRGMTWGEVDLQGRVWGIPAERMKAGRAHQVPLSCRAVEILERMATQRQQDGPDALVFEGVKARRPLSDMSLTMPLRRAKIGVTVHGFRSAFRDWCAEATSTPREVAEAALAHVLGNKVEAAYARTDHFEKRQALMDRWAAFVTSRPGEVVALKRRAGA